jgi:hypothetical protein
MKWERDICEVKGSKLTKLGSKYDWYNKSNILVVGDRSYMDTTMVEIIFLISEARCNQELISREEN